MFFLAGHPDWEVGNMYFQNAAAPKEREVGSATDLSKSMALNQWGMVFELI